MRNFIVTLALVSFMLPAFAQIGPRQDHPDARDPSTVHSEHFALHFDPGETDLLRSETDRILAVAERSLRDMRAMGVPDALGLDRAYLDVFVRDHGESIAITGQHRQLPATHWISIDENLARRDEVSLHGEMVRGLTRGALEGRMLAADCGVNPAENSWLLEGIAAYLAFVTEPLGIRHGREIEEIEKRGTESMFEPQRAGWPFFFVMQLAESDPDGMPLMMESLTECKENVSVHEMLDNRLGELGLRFDDVFVEAATAALDYGFVGHDRLLALESRSDPLGRELDAGTIALEPYSADFAYLDKDAMSVQFADITDEWRVRLLTVFADGRRGVSPVRFNGTTYINAAEDGERRALVFVRLGERGINASHLLTRVEFQTAAGDLPQRRVIVDVPFEGDSDLGPPTAGCAQSSGAAPFGLALLLIGLAIRRRK